MQVCPFTLLQSKKKKEAVFGKNRVETFFKIYSFVFSEPGSMLVPIYYTVIIITIIST